MRRLVATAVVLALGLGVAGCSAAKKAYRAGNKEAKRENWDLAVARYTLAVEGDPDDIGYRIALQNARFRASRSHLMEARQLVAEQKLEQAIEHLEIAVRYDPANQIAEDELRLARRRLQELEAQQQARDDFDSRRARAQSTRVPLPVLSPRSQAPITLEFSDQSLEKIFEALSKLSGVNILIDPDFRDQSVSVRLSGVSFEEALEQITFVNKLFFKVLNQNTVIVVPETAQKRRTYDENLVQTFYLSNADVNETVALLTKLTGIQKTAGNEALGAITVMGTPDELALAQRIVETNDKARGEVLVEVRILEVNRNNLKSWGIELANYAVQGTFAPTGQEDEVADGFTNVRAHLLSSLNLADFVVSVPSSVFADFLETDSNVRLLAAPKLRAAEGQQTSLKIGQEVPIPVTTFTATQAGSTTFAPATSFQYRNVGVTLDLTPTVTAAGEVTLELNAEFSVIGEDRNVGTGSNPLTVPTFLTRNVTGTLRLKDGETSLLGGMILQRETETIRGALGLQKIPIVGGLFRSNQTQIEDQEVILSITPYIVRAPQVTEDDMRRLYVGTRERVIVPGARPPLFGVEEEPAPPPGELQEDQPSPPDAEEPEDLEGAGEIADSYPEPPAPDTAPTSPARALFRPSEVGIAVGESREVDLVVLSAAEFREAELTIAFDGTVMEADRISPGPLLTLGGEAVGVETTQQSGRLRARFRHPTGASGSGGIATVRLRGLADGASRLEVESLVLVTASGQRLELPAAGGRVVVSSP